MTRAAAGASWLALGAPGFGAARDTWTTAPQEIRGREFDLEIGTLGVNITGRSRRAVTVQGSLPAPTLRWRQGDEVTLRVRNRLRRDSSIHWHGMILPYQMDGVPGVSFPGIPPGGSFEYRFPVRQSGTYWYHSHSGFQEQSGMYGAIVIDPVDGEPFPADREHVVVLSDWTDEDPDSVYARLKKESHFYNVNRRTVGDLWRDVRSKGFGGAARDRAMWNRMRMSDRDLSDVTGVTYTFLMNGVPPDPGAEFAFRPGEKVRLRLINAAAMTFFDFRIPGLSLRVVAADGQNVEPVTVDEIRLGVAETYDVIVEPAADVAYALFAQAMDRSGYAVGNLAPDPTLRATPPEPDVPAVLTHMDMGMHPPSGHGGNGDDPHAGHSMPAPANDPHAGHSMPAPPNDPHAGHAMPAPANDPHAGHGAMHAAEASSAGAFGPAGLGSSAPVVHGAKERGARVDMIALHPRDALGDPGIGLRGNGRRVLTYADLRSLDPTVDPREPEREIQLHLTGNMSRYMWSIGGVRFADAEPMRLRLGERVRFTLVNDTMMNHPMHLHGMWSDLETGDGARIPRKHTVIVQPGSKISHLVTVDAPGRWVYHCHLLYHMPGMFREIVVS